MKIEKNIIIAIVLIISMVAIFMFIQNKNDNNEITEVTDKINTQISEENIIEKSSGEELLIISGDRISGDKTSGDVATITSGDIVSGDNSNKETSKPEVKNDLNKKQESNITVNKSETIKKEDFVPAVDEEKITNTNQEVIEQPEIIEQPIEKVEETVSDNIGILEIPKISVYKEVYEGYSLDILDKGLGHVSDTAQWSGNIGILGHNYSQKPSGYFKNLYKLVIGDEVIYHTDFGTKKYKVSEIMEIDDNDWSVMSNTSEDKITMVTCVMNNPSKRLCVIATKV
ncbi:MAG: class D sortase [Clostridia bacterium]|nr:class D sortase [Clostridia bacterium]